MPGATESERRAALEALSRKSGFDVRLFDRLFPTRPWREVVPSELWYRRDVLDHQVIGARFSLHAGLEDLLGQVHAATLMEYLPPVPWSVLRRHGVEPPMRAPA